MQILTNLPISRCLIFKVLLASLIEERALHFITLSCVCQALFSSLFWDSLDIVSLARRFVKIFFRLSRRLDYNTTPASPCQRVFSNFLQISPLFFPACGSRERHTLYIVFLHRFRPVRGGGLPCLTAEYPDKIASFGKPDGSRHLLDREVCLLEQPAGRCQSRLPQEESKALLTGFAQDT